MYALSPLLQKPVANAALAGRNRGGIVLAEQASGSLCTSKIMTRPLRINDSPPPDRERFARLAPARGQKLEFTRQPDGPAPCC